MALTLAARQFHGLLIAVGPRMRGREKLYAPAFASMRWATSESGLTKDSTPPSLRRKVTAKLDSILDATKIESTLAGSPMENASGSNLLYQGEWVDNWQQLLEEARAAYPERAGPRRSRAIKRLKLKWKNVRRQHNRQKEERIAAHNREMLDRKKRAIERKGWFGPMLAS